MNVGYTSATFGSLFQAIILSEERGVEREGAAGKHLMPCECFSRDDIRSGRSRDEARHISGDNENGEEDTGEITYVGYLEGRYAVFF